jgi:hypothetical protein
MFGVSMNGDFLPSSSLPCPSLRFPTGVRAWMLGGLRMRVRGESRSLYGGLLGGMGVACLMDTGPVEWRGLLVRYGLGFLHWFSYTRRLLHPSVVR